MSTTFLTTPADVSPTSTGWQDIDLTSYCPGASGVILHIVNTGASSYAFGCRKNGSTDNRTDSIGSGAHLWVMIGLDGSDICEVNVGNTAVDVYLVGYFDSDAVFNTNATSVTVNSVSYADRHAPGAYAGAIYESYGGAYNPQAFRSSGSTDNRLHDQGVPETSHFWALVKPGTSNYVQIANAQTGTYYAYYIGYLGSNTVSLNTNGTNRSLSTTGSWQDLAALPSGAIGGVYQMFDNGWTGYNEGVRENGASESIVRYFMQEAYAFVKCDANRVCEAQISNVDCDLFEMGYFIGGGGGTNHPLAGTIAGTGDFAGPLNRSIPLAGEVSCTGALAGVLNRSIPLAGTIAATSSFDGIAIVNKVLLGSVVGTGTFEGVLGFSHTLAGSLVGTSVGNAALSQNMALSGSIDSSVVFYATWQTSVQAPTSVTATPSGSDIYVDWDDVPSADSYVVERRIDGGSWTQVSP